MVNKDEYIILGNDLIFYHYNLSILTLIVHALQKKIIHFLKLHSLSDSFSLHRF